jgi:outer membrane protein assembly factor BamE (lipoprotein component of BamABCDE complex)
LSSRSRPLALIAVLAGCVNPPSSPAPANAGAGPTAAAADDHPERALKKGMTADQVRQIMGAPVEIKPKPAPTGTAEVWVYRRTVLGPP